MSLQALVPIADGIEEIEAVTIIDTLRRAEIEVTVAAVGETCITASMGVKILADAKLEDCMSMDYDVIILPGGVDGAKNMALSEPLKQKLLAQDKKKGLIAAICASPALVLQPFGLLQGRFVTCYPAFMDLIEPTQIQKDKVVIDGNLITSQGPATALAFAYAIVESLLDAAKAHELKKAMLYDLF